MLYRTIVVFLDDESQAPALVNAATLVADMHDAHLIGVFIDRPLDIYVARVAETVMSEDFNEVLFKEQHERMMRLRTLFETKTDNQCFSTEWRFIQNRSEPVGNVLLRIAGTADLLVMGRPSASVDWEHEDIVHKTLLDAPVPVMLIPEDFGADSIGHHILLGWNADPGASRSAHAALPMMTNAENVWIHRVSEHARAKDSEHGMDVDLANMLARHGINVVLSNDADSGSEAGKSLLNEAQLRGADVLVSGAFGHARIRDIFIGSTTKYLLNNAKIPLLMTH